MNPLIKSDLDSTVLSGPLLYVMAKHGKMLISSKIVLENGLKLIKNVSVYTARANNNCIQVIRGES